MDVAGRRIWQVSAGDTDRSHVDLCLRWDVILNGPGARGPWPNAKDDLAEIVSGKKHTDLWRFCEEGKEGDLVVLRAGTSEVHGVGELQGGYEWADEFDDVDGWDLQHARRVRWLWKSDGEPTRFPAHTLKWGDTFQELNAEPVASWLRGLEVPSEAFDRTLARLPEECPRGTYQKEVTSDDLAEYLFDRGIAAGSVDALIDQMDDLRRIAGWYLRSETNPSEGETVAFLAVPLLRSLGWTPQRMAIEWRRVDIALFKQLPREDKYLVAAVETKRAGCSCLTARSQAEGYAQEPGRESCRRLIVTDGLRYGVYKRQRDGSFGALPTAYLNLNRMLSSYPILECGGAQEALLLMAADWPGS